MSRHDTIQQFDDGYLFNKNVLGHEKRVQIIVWLKLFLRKSICINYNMTKLNALNIGQIFVVL